MSKPGRKKRSERGQALLEFAFVAPLVVVFLLAAIDFGIAVERRLVLDHAAREGARFASVGGHALSGGSVATEAEIIAFTMAQGQDAPDSVAVCYEDTNGNGTLGDVGDSVTVTANYTHDFVTAFTSMVELSSPSVEMNPSASARVERAAQSPQSCT